MTGWRYWQMTECGPVELSETYMLNLARRAEIEEAGEAFAEPIDLADMRQSLLGNAGDAASVPGDYFATCDDNGRD